ncbi:uncharacterized protein LOC125228058 [Leguminivora glycinivorella]|uniref:uncharacterized protein LOC125228058 n=1 Tax=Leguminivora glycinivorella TaxID=1035111 RepID=UPI00200C9105|nr:uncharacterized protein LOC125228058 [Leguminivora glycinivorella]
MTIMSEYVPEQLGINNKVVEHDFICFQWQKRSSQNYALLQTDKLHDATSYHYWLECWRECSTSGVPDSNLRTGMIYVPDNCPERHIMDAYGVCREPWCETGEVNCKEPVPKRIVIGR